MGRVPAAARRPARAADAHDRGVPRHRAELERVRAGRRTLPGRGQPARARRVWPRRPARKSTADRHYQARGAGLPVARRARAISNRSHARDGRRAAGSGTGEYVGSPADADDALVRRLVDAAVLPDLLARELAATLLEAVTADVAVVFAELPGGDVRADRARRHRCRRRAHRSRGSAVQGGAYGAGSADRRADRPRARRPAPRRGRRRRARSGHPLLRRVRMMAAVARQGFDLCGVRDRPTAPVDATTERPLEPLLPGFLCASAAMHSRRRSDSAAAGQRPHGADHRRERHRQGADRARHPCRVAAQRGDVPALQLHDDHARAGRQPVVRPSPRIVHRRGLRSAGPDPHRRRRHAVPR